MTDLTPLIELDRLARKDGKVYAKRRFLYQEIAADEGRHFTGIAGPRGWAKRFFLNRSP